MLQSTDNKNFLWTLQDHGNVSLGRCGSPLFSNNASNANHVISLLAQIHNFLSPELLKPCAHTSSFLY